MLDSGKVTLCDIVDVSESGGMPLKKLRPVHTGMFENRIIGYNRRYAALGVNQDLAALIRIWRPPLRKDGSAMVQIGMVAILEGSEIDGQYRVDVVQPLQNFDGINILEMTLSRLETNYEVEGDAPPIDPGDFEYYEGSYEVTPDVVAQTLATALKLMRSDVTVLAIPYAETSNEHGTTVVISS